MCDGIVEKPTTWIIKPEAISFTMGTMALNCVDGVVMALERIVEVCFLHVYLWCNSLIVPFRNIKLISRGKVWN